MRQKIEYVWDLNKTNIAMVFAFARGGFETFNKCVRRLSLERNNRKTQVLEKNFSVNFEKVKNNKGKFQCLLKRGSDSTLQTFRSSKLDNLRQYYLRQH